MPTQIEKLQHIKNPLTLIAVFAGLAEIVSIGVLPLLKDGVQYIFVWYVMLFPTLLVVVFFLTLNFNHKVLYAPGDFRTDEGFLETLKGKFTSTPNTEGEILRNFWKPDGILNTENDSRLKKWLSDNGLETTITFFLTDQSFSDYRKKAVVDLNLE